MKGLRYLFLVMMAALALSACSKADEVDQVTQAEIDEKEIIEYLSKISMPAVRHSSGVYYSIIQEGSGENPTTSSTVTIIYEGWLMADGDVFDKTKTGVPASFLLSTLIYGWQIGVPLIKPGGKIRLYIPSGLAYGVSGTSAIPANSVLVFDVELVSFVN